MATEGGIRVSQTPGAPYTLDTTLRVLLTMDHQQSQFLEQIT